MLFPCSCEAAAIYCRNASRISSERVRCSRFLISSSLTAISGGMEIENVRVIRAIRSPVSRKEARPAKTREGASVATSMWLSRGGVHTMYHFVLLGAGRGNRTPVSTLGRSHSATKPYPHKNERAKPIPMISLRSHRRLHFVHK